MERIRTLLQKISNLSHLNEKLSTIDIDLMMDYTKVLYADLLEMRNRAAFNNHIPVFTNTTENTTTTHNVGSNKEEDTRRTPLHVGINDKYQFISELFNNDKEAYENVLLQIALFETYDDAVNWLEQKYSWSKEDDSVQGFYSLLSAYYSH